MIAALLLLAQAAVPPPAPMMAPVPKAGAQADAAAIWEQRCTFCHGADGMGQTKKGKQLKAPNFAGARWQKHTSDDEIVRAIADGIPKRKMPAFKDRLSPEEIQAMVPFLRAFASGAK